MERLGFTVDDLDAALAEGSPAMEKGVETGDIIRRFGQRRVDSAADLAQSVAETLDAGRSGVLLLIERDGRERFVQIGFAEE